MVHVPRPGHTTAPADSPPVIGADTESERIAQALAPRDRGNLPALSAQPLIRLDAYVAEDGSTVVNGHLLTMGGTRPPNEAILDAVAMFARTLGTPVAATVIDRSVRQVARLRVHPDGSSRTIAEEEDLPPGRERTTAEERTFPPLARVERIIQHAKREELHAAFVLAGALREHLTLRRGAEDELSLEARAIEAYIAFRRGDYSTSTGLALTVARIRCGSDLHRAVPEVARATAAWQRLQDQTQVATRGQELLHMWEKLSAEGLLREPSHRAMAQAVRSRMERGTQYPETPATAPAPAALPAAPEAVAPEDAPLAPTRRGLRRFTRLIGRSEG
ncbi:hypothetical protein ACFWI0_17845 [[Kitasatospora] papulosa]|uniref:hypothetical protein n=1 Tax=Streptomyces TaxID=1883 RepID=UPI00056DA444|nr:MULTISPECIES: hypothetical protein [Streptomyces]MDX3182607.1 hypothetical protein [Streptomyces sp. ME02-7008A-1]MDX3303060.1 hypothetical protein [Streptomyces sp. ME02-7008A]